ncbi:exopolysaccharide biosynthesis polyprenyl glycosylphosphotransferase [Sulfurovum sp. XTW-4]|uniref:Exopolysaccharide biosynthesis polyprenyl glycosylphosphotransferase n=1 Tax=Sulfurovum xiamenensis TaxID=3019066 RepID=A0ABT7QPQ0_9BACT|nr:exopolysaccharide biosynthesis polyprenyl glycosylphosphotransferase [Sulfurovum xiamenensis]MDM5263070.1 exopolysaccharide biosynthesis polyprenyl glycosylphosphotransferase [Sulfurovum xiamenensis]
MRYTLFKTSLYTLLLVINLMAAYGVSSLLIEHIEDHPMSKYIWQIGIYLFFYFYFKLFHSRMVSSNESYLIIKANVLALITIFSIIFLLKESESYSRLYVLVFFILNGLIPVSMYVIKRHMMMLPWLREDIIVVCDTSGYGNIKQWFTKDNAFGFDVEKYIFIDKGMKNTCKEIESTLKIHNFDTAVVAIDNYSVQHTFYYMEFLQNHVNRLIVLPRMAKIPLINAEVFTSINHRGLAFSTRNNLLNPVDKMFKMVFDFIMTCILILLFSPIILILYILVFILTKGKPIFKHERIGKNGKPFDVYKFRTMHLNAKQILEGLLESDPDIRKEWQKEFKLKDDPRITKIGAFLRRTSLDELPQLINVMKGEMSLVGPRPIVQDEIKKYGEYFRYFKAVKPGITGLWQISGRNDVDYNERVQLDTWYVRNWSIEQDFIILMKTIVTVLLKKGSY